MVADVEEQARFGPYRVLRQVGSGGMGSVFEAEDTGLGHRVALKLLHPHVARRPGAVKRFLREGRAAARIRHPHVVQVFALGLEGDTPYLAMELLHGDNLSQVIAREGRLSVDAALDVVLPVVAAVAAAHDAGVIHRDLKPSNVCITQGPGAHACPKVVDFGVSKVIVGDGTDDVTVSDSVVGTAAYMSPEQARAASNASFRSDQYSLAALLYQCVTGKLPFSGRSVYEIVESIMTTPLGPPSLCTSGIPPALDDAVLRAMSRNPDDRYPSVRAFGAALLVLASERSRLALRAEFEERPTHRWIDAGYPLARNALVTRPDSDLTAFGDTPIPTISRHGARAASSVEHALWVGVAGLLVWLAIVAFRHRPSGVSSGLTVESPLATVGSIAPEPVQRTVDAPPRSVPPGAPVSVAPATSSAIVAKALESPGRPARWHPSRRPSDRAPLPAAVTVGDNGAPILP